MDKVLLINNAIFTFSQQLKETQTRCKNEKTIFEQVNISKKILITNREKSKEKNQ